MAGPAAAHEDPPTISQAFAGPRPGEAIGIDLLNYQPKPGVHLVAESPVFAHPIRMDDPAAKVDGLGVKAPIPMSAEPGSYPLVIKARGKVVARDTIRVRPPERPSVEVDDGRARRPGTRVNLFFDDLYPGENGDSFTARSPAFASPVRLTRGKDSWNNTRVFSALNVPLPFTLHDGTYAIWVTDGDGRRKARTRLEVRSARPGDDDYLGNAEGPAFFGKTGSPLRAQDKGFTAAAGTTMYVKWQDASPDPGEEERLTATSPAFQAPARLASDVIKGHEMDPPLFWGPARIKPGLKPGRYPVTVVSHRGRVTKNSYLTVTQGSAHDDGGLPTAVWAGASAGTLALGATAAVLLVRRRRRAPLS
ncbi:hypothetical protein [Streptomyces roseochromogenus]|uniref:Uncharacterized protein n=1 Tax=Streptomyces roseochromogenus subsp. oscitans DS 12.976 TaxID=1352936 RepID=V6KRB3_STRRC|nr:hypothetical protein [Streptomyces roseochromogenus]EST34642.1 hypothetical protein M878_09305 [Streptomyces roseochromogenus subsp. oscitans DS 12.976]